MAVIVLFVASIISGPVRSQETVVIDASKKGENISPYIYGQFIEHLGRCIYGGIWAEMLADRKFYDAVGSEGSPWKSIDDCRIRMVKDGAFVGEHSPESFTTDADEPRWLGVRQKELAVRKGKTYPGYAWVKVSEGIEKVEVHFHGNPSNHDAHDAFKLPVQVGDYYKIEFEFKPTVDSNDVEIKIAAFGKGTFTVGCVSLMPADNVQGMRADTLSLLKELDSPVYRWPGGNFVSGYDWNDGVGDRDRRPPRKNPAWKGIEHNDFGLDEFMVFCRLLNTEPYIAVNAGGGEVDNAIAELEYANGFPDSPQGKRRATHGHADPYNVKFWGIGNEMYGNWQIGYMSVEKYAEKNNRFVDAFRKFDPKLVLIAVGNVGKWDEAIMRKCADHMDLISEHFYVGDWNINKNWTVPEHVASVPGHIKQICDAHRKYREKFAELKGKDIRIAMDEWNYWYGPQVFGELGTRYFVKDGLGIAAGLHEYFRNSDMVYMANYAQTVNVIGCIKTTSTNAQFETTGLVLKLYRQCFGTKPLMVESPKPLDIAAALTEDGKYLTIGIVNPTDKEVAIQFMFDNVNPGEGVQRFEIAGNDPLDFNDPDQPQKIDIVELKAKTDINQPVQVPPYSVTLLKVAVIDY